MVGLLEVFAIGSIKALVSDSTIALRALFIIIVRVRSWSKYSEEAWYIALDLSIILVNKYYKLSTILLKYKSLYIIKLILDYVI